MTGRAIASELAVYKECYWAVAVKERRARLPDAVCSCATGRHDAERTEYGRVKLFGSKQRAAGGKLQLEQTRFVHSKGDVFFVSKPPWALAASAASAGGRLAARRHGQRRTLIGWNR